MGGQDTDPPEPSNGSLPRHAQGGRLRILDNKCESKCSNQLVKIGIIRVHIIYIVGINNEILEYQRLIFIFLIVRLAATRTQNLYEVRTLWPQARAFLFRSSLYFLFMLKSQKVLVLLPFAVVSFSFFIRFCLFQCIR